MSSFYSLRVANPELNRRGNNLASDWEIPASAMSLLLLSIFIKIRGQRNDGKSGGEAGETLNIL